MPFLQASYVPRILMPLLYRTLICYNKKNHIGVPVEFAVYACHPVVLSPVLPSLCNITSDSLVALGMSDPHSLTCHLGVILRVKNIW